MKINKNRISAILSPSITLDDKGTEAATAGQPTISSNTMSCHPNIGRCDMFLAAHFSENPADGDESLIFKSLTQFLKKHPMVEPAMHRWAQGMAPSNHGIPYKSDPDEATAKRILAKFLLDSSTDKALAGGEPLTSQRDFYCYIPDPLGHELIRVCYAEFMVNELIAGKSVPVVKKLRANQEFMLTFVLRFRVPVLKPTPAPQTGSQAGPRIEVKERPSGSIVKP